MPMQEFSFEVKSVGVGDVGSFTGLASTYGGPPDAYNEVVMPGAFTRTLADQGKKRPLLWQHREPIGLVTLSDTPAGLVADAQLTMTVGLAKDAYELLKAGVVRSLSIGFQTLREQIVGDVKQLLEVKLFEISLVVVPANERALITGVKSRPADQAAEIRRVAESFRALRTGW